MEMVAAHLHHDFFLSPSPHHLAELRIDPPHSAIAFSTPGGADGTRKRRCLLPAASQRKKMLLELHPFDFTPSPSPPPLPRRSPATAPPMVSRVGSPASEFSFPSAHPWSGGGGGNIFAFAVTMPTTPSPTGSNVSAVSFVASPGHRTTPTGSTASGGLTFVTSPKKPTTPTGPTANGGFMFTPSPEQPLTPTGSTAVASLPSPKHARTGSTDSGGLAFFPSPIRHTSSPTSPAFVFTASRTVPPPMRKSIGNSKKRPRPQLDVVTARRRSLRERAVPQQVIQPPQKVAKTGVLITSEASRSSIRSGSSARPCCTFFTSPAKASNQDARKVFLEESRSSSPCGSLAWSRCTFAQSPARPSSAEKASKEYTRILVREKKYTRILVQGKGARGGSVQCGQRMSHAQLAGSLHRR
ncbi:hypothetical protein BRADI_3g23880v3 [Brachypodium distachyon]|uniref:Uncharacterized protein n=1 Tax=Brachypodium distachyon TaxID=15368 RepID=A0A2K2CZ46_BRADI|nr:hypothetical protein BRADI_3g23880v3 [Brachypodium distachyon]